MSLRRLSGVPTPAGAYTPIGARQNRVTFYSPGGRDPQNGDTLDPQSFTTTWAAIRALSGQELLKAQQIAQTITQLVIVAFQTGLRENMTILTEDGREFQIRDIQDPDSRGVELWIYCEETGQNAGQS